jgi:hypothetical protein
MKKEIKEIKPNIYPKFDQTNSLRIAVDRIYNQYGNNLDLFFQDVKKDLAKQHKKLEKPKSFVM